MLLMSADADVLNWQQTDMSTEPLKKQKKKSQSGGSVTCRVLLLDGSEVELQVAVGVDVTWFCCL